jgi:mannose-6-phosphate isomerase-like protein (cupin superfamily)
MHLHVDQAPGTITPPPYERDVRVVLSPLLQPELRETQVVVGYSQVAPGQHGSRHNHPTEAEVWMFFAGTGRAVVGDEQFDVRSGSVVYTPPGVYHQFFNTGAETVKLYWYYSPAGAERDVLEGVFR